ncbi:MAG: hypothetical protein LQ338_005959 [Usnochroma carphineum]|nr:MAG: hypothetical protein LQ338_005959 [Usnochroma carphineum]
MALTPVKGKKALPLSTFLLFFEQSSHQSDWELGLDRVKSRYWKGHWKECADLCHELLQDVHHSSSALRATCLYFYAAICYDSIGRAINDLSEKLLYLERAKESYRAAAASLPPREEPACARESDDRAIISQVSDLQTPTKRRLTQQFDVFSSFTPLPQRRFARESVGALIPSPLHIQQSSGPINLPMTPPRGVSIRNSHEVFRQPQGYPPCMPPKKITPSSPPSPARRLSIMFSTSSNQWLQNRSAERYNTYLADLAGMLQKHIVILDTLMSNIRDIRSSKNVKSLAVFGEDREARAADLRERIVRLRNKDWKRERFAPERYRDLCAMALAEL